MAKKVLLGEHLGRCTLVTITFIPSRSTNFFIMSNAGNNAIGPQGIEDSNDPFSSPEVLRTLVSHIPDWKTAKYQKHGRQRFYKAIAAEINVIHKLNRIDRKSMNERAMVSISIEYFNITLSQNI